MALFKKTTPTQGEHSSKVQDQAMAKDESIVEEEEKEVSDETVVEGDDAQIADPVESGDPGVTAVVSRDIEHFLRIHLEETGPLTNFTELVDIHLARLGRDRPAHGAIPAEVFDRINEGMREGIRTMLTSRVLQAAARGFEADSYREAVAQVGAVVTSAGLPALFPDMLARSRATLENELSELSKVLSDEAARFLNEVSGPREAKRKRELNAISDIDVATRQGKEEMRDKLTAYCRKYYRIELDSAFAHIEDNGPYRIAQRFAEHMLTIFGAYAHDNGIIVDAARRVFKALRLGEIPQESLATEVAFQINAALAKQPAVVTSSGAEKALGIIQSIRDQLRIIEQAMNRGFDLDDGSTDSDPVVIPSQRAAAALTEEVSAEGEGEQTAKNAAAGTPNSQ